MAAQGRPARLVIGKSQGQHDGQPEDGANNYELSAPRAVARVHEVENDESGLDRGDAESDDDVERTEVLKRGPNRKAGTDNQREKDCDIDSWRNDVFGMFSHALSPRLLNDAGQS